MAFQKGMARYGKGDDGYYRPMKKGGFYKAGDGKMYAMSKHDYGTAGEGVDAPGKQPSDQPHINPYPGTNPDYPGEEKKGGYKKGEVTVDDFQKSLDELEAAAGGGTPENRKDELLAKAMTEDLNQEEQDFLFKALGGEVPVDDNPQIVDDLTKSFTDNEPIQKALDVSEYLEAQHGATVDALTALGSILEKSETRQHNYNIILAKAVHQTGELLKAVSQRMGIIERQPAHAPRSRGVGQPAAGNAIEKSFAGDPPADEQMSKSEILDAMEGMMQKSDPNGSDASQILLATAKYEQTNQLSKAMYGKIMEFRQQNAH